jgi:hypothetical protein
MRRRPSPLSVTRPPPSNTTLALVFLTFAVALILIVTGFGPQANRMIPPARTAATTAAEVQPADVPWPTTWFACEVLTACPAAGTATVRVPDAPRADGAHDASANVTATPTARLTPASLPTPALG